MDTKTQISKCYIRKYGSLGLNFTVRQLNCSDAQYSAKAVDKVALLVFISVALQQLPCVF